ncbi:hypothetical protein B0T24DRAFT_723835 [Lasiosphaeria ovina]|uniref:Uncharacterized protein n=1 Tax=Lasiosphaeria ovina TaxID=92902 RepID=A0AAE0N1R5_9PEZI|nr:hypothetical protein B0T24DRAFT_723835 [Lasiosphaeria ovina]
MADSTPHSHPVPQQQPATSNLAPPPASSEPVKKEVSLADVITLSKTKKPSTNKKITAPLDASNISRLATNTIGGASPRVGHPKLVVNLPTTESPDPSMTATFVVEGGPTGINVDISHFKTAETAEKAFSHFFGQSQIDRGRWVAVTEETEVLGHQALHTTETAVVRYGVILFVLHTRPSPTQPTDHNTKQHAPSIKDILKFAVKLQQHFVASESATESVSAQLNVTNAPELMSISLKDYNETPGSQKKGKFSIKLSTFAGLTITEGFKNVDNGRILRPMGKWEDGHMLYKPLTAGTGALEIYGGHNTTLVVSHISVPFKVVE